MKTVDEIAKFKMAQKVKYVGALMDIVGKEGLVLRSERSRSEETMYYVLFVDEKNSRFVFETSLEEVTE